jgi:8-amino-7-oxononanoate synthase
MFEKLQKQLAKRKSENSYRVLKLNNKLVDFCSNDYLGISRLLKFENNEKVGSTGSRLLQGNYPAIENLEKQLAVFHQSTASLIYSSGYTANVGLFSSILQKGDVIFYDEFTHASVKDGVRLSFAKSYSFKHNDVPDLEKKITKLKREALGEVYIAVESVYSMDGDQAPLKGLVEVCEKYECVLVVDEAHAVGVFGANGEGLVQHLGLASKVAIRLVTFGKALGCHGAVILCSPLVKEYLINFSRSFIYSTALPPSSVKVIEQAYLFMNDNRQIELLKNNIQYFKTVAKERNIINLIESDSAVQCIITSGNNEAKDVSNQLQKKGFDVRPILAPTVPIGFERIRICVHAFNDRTEINELVRSLSGINKNKV